MKCGRAFRATGCTLMDAQLTAQERHSVHADVLYMPGDEIVIQSDLIAGIAWPAGLDLTEEIVRGGAKA